LVFSGKISSAVLQGDDIYRIFEKNEKNK